MDSSYLPALLSIWNGAMAEHGLVATAGQGGEHEAGQSHDAENDGDDGDLDDDQEEEADETDMDEEDEDEEDDDDEDNVGDMDVEEYEVDGESGLPHHGATNDAQRILAFFERLLHNANNPPNSAMMGRKPVPRDPNRFPKVPSHEGIGLMRSGNFGTNDTALWWKKALPGSLLDRELALELADTRIRSQKIMAQNLIPGTAETIMLYKESVYSGQFSDDGNFFFSCAKDLKVRIYDTTDPFNWTLYKSMYYPLSSWTLTDASLSPNNCWLAYSALKPAVCLAPTDPHDRGDPYFLSMNDIGHLASPGVSASTMNHAGIFSVRFSGDGRELVAGTSANVIIVYDIEARRVLHCVRGHNNDVNAVCFADKSSPHVLYSGSDDSHIKVWDRRSMGDGREAGAFVGHTEGITYIDSKGDGRYVLSNGKDQCMKLWDIRMVMSTARFREIAWRRRFSDFDYRMEAFDEDEWDPDPNDNSVVTFRGHKVLRTLIRCHFSPPGSTNSRYVYSGSQDGQVFVWNLDGTLAKQIDVQTATSIWQTSRQQANRRISDLKACVRDASWHPTAPILAASSITSLSMNGGVISLHWAGDSKEGDEDDCPKIVNSSFIPFP